MKPRRLHPVFVWLACCVHVAASMAGQLGVVVCRDADGPAHVEWSGEHCCVDDHATPGVGSGVSADDTCSAGQCDDHRVGVGSVVVEARRARVLGDGGFVPFAWAGAGVDLRPVAVRWGVRATPETGPPRQVERGVRSTVLIL